jgi:mannose-6-phosphate isomerase
MFRELRNEPRPYAWGDFSSIAHWQGSEPPGGPQAELWLGTHPGSEAQVIADAEGQQPLSSWLRSRGLPSTLPFLVKLLAAKQPLSIQVHPSREQARAGFARENDAGIALDDPRRNYQDDSDKPEILIAWSDEFHALVGFADASERTSMLAKISHAVSDPPLVAPLEQALSRGTKSLAQWLFSGAPEVVGLSGALETVWTAPGAKPPGVWQRVSAHYPRDPGALAALFMEHVRLNRGEALFVPARIPHAYLEGFGLEVMAPSDNVLRGGLTSKKVDCAELLVILDPEPLQHAVCEPTGNGPHGERFAPPGVPFVVDRFSGHDVDIELEASGPAVVVIESGEFSSEDGEEPLMRGGRAYIGAGGKTARWKLRGSGCAYVVSAL